MPRGRSRMMSSRMGPMDFRGGFSFRKHKSEGNSAKDLTLKNINHNYCRNADNDPNGPWCFIDGLQKNGENKWDYCHVPSCDTTTEEISVYFSEETNRNDFVNRTQTCYDSKTKGTDYYGTIHKTRSGCSCQNWHSSKWDTHLPSEAMRGVLSNSINHSYCRNFDGAHRPWCYTNCPEQEYKWEYCRIDICKTEEKATKPGRPNRGRPKKTIFDISIFKPEPGEIECGLRAKCDSKYYADDIECNTQKNQASSGEFPWQVILRSTKTGEAVCGGFILNKNFIVTTASCLINSKTKREYSINDLVVAVGDNTLNGVHTDNAGLAVVDFLKQSLGRDTHAIERIISHEKFNIKKKYHDIALIELKSPIVYGVTIGTIRNNSNSFKSLTRPVCLTQRDATKKKSTCNFAGFDSQATTQTKNTQPFQDFKLGMTFRSCKSYLRRYRITLNSGASNSQFCANIDSKRKKICDMLPSSSLSCPITNMLDKDTIPSIDMKNENKYATVGISSIGFDCKPKLIRRKGPHGVFTKLSNYLEWISEYTTNVQILD